MKDIVKPCHHSLSEDATYKEVVVIGNGPSGLITSLLLSGWSPRLLPVPERVPLDPMLRARLGPHAGRDLLELDLPALAEGLEGRSNNPMALLLDNLLNPCADLGLSFEPLVEWEYDVDRQIDHVVLGKGPPGGAWHTFDPAVLTLSPSGWLALPPHSAVPGSAASDRAKVGSVAEYYRGYVRTMGLKRYFRSGAVVTGVTPRRNRACEAPACPLAARWCVVGYDLVTRRPLRYQCARVVLASGASDRPSRLCGPVARHVAHRGDVLPQGDDAVLVVGSGLSAADAVVAARRAGRRVAHVFRSDTSALDNLSPAVYPDYCEVSKMMREGRLGNHSNYIPLPDNALVEVTPLDNSKETAQRKRVKLVDLTTNQITELTVNAIFVLIGSRPDLHFLPPSFDLNCMNIKDRVDKREVCPKCNAKHAAKRKLEERQCFFKDRWHYIKSMVGQSIQSCKSRYWDYANDADINGNDSSCEQKDFIKRVDGNIKEFEENCSCLTNPHSNGLGYGVDPSKPINPRTNPILIDKSTHEVVNAPKGLYALGPLSSDNFVRFISGGAVAAVAHMWRERKLELTD